MYAALWRRLPGPAWARVVASVLLLAAVIAFCFLWLFPRIAPYMPFNETTVEDPVALVTSIDDRSVRR